MVKSSIENRLLQSRQSSWRRGIAITYTIILLPVLFTVVSLAVDLGHVEITKTQMRTAVDAAAKYGAMGLHNTLAGVSAAYSQAAYVAGQNGVDGSALVLTNSASDHLQDIEIGVWTAGTGGTNGVFTPNSDPNQCNAVRVTGRHVATRNNAIRLYCLSVFYNASYDMAVSAIAMVSPGQDILQNVKATSNPFLAGALPGTEVSNPNPHNNPDYSAGTPGHPDSSPVASQAISAPGTEMTFDGVNGGANNFTSDVNYSADGNLGWICANGDGDFPSPVNDRNISTMIGPIDSLVGVYLDDSVPGSQPVPPNLDYSTDAERNKSNYTPALAQVFYIGDGRTDQGLVQTFTVPQGATRLFIGTWDCYEWNNNQGSFNITIHTPSVVTLVQ